MFTGLPGLAEASPAAVTGTTGHRQEPGHNAIRCAHNAGGTGAIDGRGDDKGRWRKPVMNAQAIDAYPADSWITDANPTLGVPALTSLR